MRNLLLLALLTVTTITSAQLKPEIGVGLTRHQAEQAVKGLKSEIGYIEWYKNVNHKEYDDAIIIEIAELVTMDFRFKGNELYKMTVDASIPLPKGADMSSVMRQMGGVASPEMVDMYGRPSSSSLNQATWNNTIDEVTGKRCRVFMTMKPLGNSVNIYMVKTLI